MVGHISMDVVNLLTAARMKAVEFSVKNGELHYKGPKGALTAEDIERIRSLKDQIVPLLERPGIADSELRSRRESSGRAPLAYSQLAHWNLYRLYERPAIRQIASATRLRGPLCVDALRESVEAITHRHSALRTRIVAVDGVPQQESVAATSNAFRVDDLTAIPQRGKEAEVERRIQALITEPIDVSVGPLFEARLLKLRDEEHVLVLVMEHMISDARSRTIVMRELLNAYAQRLRGVAVVWPDVPVQLGEYAARQRAADAAWLATHGAYWNQRFGNCGRLRFPVEDDRANAGTQWGSVDVRIDAVQKARLREWTRQRRTTLPMSMFTAYVALVMRWCCVSDGVIRYQCDGRTTVGVEGAVGYFAATLYLRLELLDGDDFIQLLARVTQEYCRAHEHYDASRIEACEPRPDFTRNTIFNWVPCGKNVDITPQAGLQGLLTICAVPFAHPMGESLQVEVDHEPTLQLYDTDAETVGAVHFPLNRYSMSAMERFALNLQVFIEALLSKPADPVKDIVLV